jgi:YgiT-type zinc finger domain-containing protein
MRKAETCEFCEGSLEFRRIRAPFHFKGDTIYVEGVPAWVCTKCGEHYFDAPVYKRLEDIARHRHLIKELVCFPLAAYEEVPS